ncbi:MAG: hypothetical protein Q7S84_00830 [bacterium]|nr:hypothetical protein [bacterium]
MSETMENSAIAAKKAQATVRGTLYHLFSTFGSLLPLEPEREVCIRWFDGTGTFDELIKGVYSQYELQLDDRNFRPAMPGYLVMGKRYPFTFPECHATAIGVFIPEGTEQAVVKQLAKDFGAIAFFPITLRELGALVPGATLLVKE